MSELDRNDNRKKCVLRVCLNKSTDVALSRRWAVLPRRWSSNGEKTFCEFSPCSQDVQQMARWRPETSSMCHAWHRDIAVRCTGSQKNQHPFCSAWCETLIVDTTVLGNCSGANTSARYLSTSRVLSVLTRDCAANRLVTQLMCWQGRLQTSILPCFGRQTAQT